MRTLRQPGCPWQVLFHTDVKTDGACTLLEALTSNSTLQKLDLGGNDLGPEVSLCSDGVALMGLSGVSAVLLQMLC